MYIAGFLPDVITSGEKSGYVGGSKMYAMSVQMVCVKYAYSVFCKIISVKIII
jgi:hypothetical protein